MSTKKAARHGRQSQKIQAKCEFSFYYMVEIYPHFRRTGDVIAEFIHCYPHLSGGGYGYSQGVFHGVVAGNGAEGSLGKAVKAVLAGHSYVVCGKAGNNIAKGQGQRGGGFRVRRAICCYSGE